MMFDKLGRRREEIISIVNPDFETAEPFSGTRGPRDRLISIP
jgi:hypothetical protein